MVLNGEVGKNLAGTKIANKSRSISKPKGRPTLNSNLINDYGSDIKKHLINLEKQNKRTEFLERH